MTEPAGQPMVHGPPHPLEQAPVSRNKRLGELPELVVPSPLLLSLEEVWSRIYSHNHGWSSASRMLTDLTLIYSLGLDVSKEVS